MQSLTEPGSVATNLVSINSYTDLQEACAEKNNVPFYFDSVFGETSLCSHQTAIALQAFGIHVAPIIIFYRYCIRVRKTCWTDRSTPVHTDFLHNDPSTVIAKAIRGRCSLSRALQELLAVYEHPIRAVLEI